MNFRVLCLMLIAWTISSEYLFAQGATGDEDLVTPMTPGTAPPRRYIGPIVGYNKVMNSGGFPSFSTDINCPTFSDGSGNGFFAGFTMEFLLGDPKNSKSSIVTRILYDYLPSSFTQTGDHLPSLVHDPTNNTDHVIFTTTEHEAVIKYATVDLDIMYRFNLGNTSLGIIAGVAPGYAITQKVIQKFKLIDPANAILVEPPPGTPNPPLRYEDGHRTAVIKDEDILNAAKLRLGIKAGVQYEIILRRMTLIPSINYNFGILNMTSTDSWRVNAVQAGVELRFAI